MFIYLSMWNKPFRLSFYMIVLRISQSPYYLRTLTGCRVTLSMIVLRIWQSTPLPANFDWLQGNFVNDCSKDQTEYTITCELWLAAGWLCQWSRCWCHDRHCSHLSRPLFKSTIKNKEHIKVENELNNVLIMYAVSHIIDTYCLMIIFLFFRE